MSEITTTNSSIIETLTVGELINFLKKCDPRACIRTQWLGDLVLPVADVEYAASTNEIRLISGEPAALAG